MDMPAADSLAKKRADFGTAVVGALVIKVTFKVLETSTESFSVATVTVVQVLALLGSVAIFCWLARTAFLCAAALGWAAWQRWLVAIACGVLQWVAWVMYFVFRSQVARKMAAPPPPDAS